MDVDIKGEVWGSSMRIRVALDGTKPLKRALKIRTVLGDEQLIFFTYDRLSSFYYLCGCLGNLSRQCELQLQEGFCDPGEIPPFGPWMRAPPLSSNQIHFAGLSNGGTPLPRRPTFRSVSPLQFDCANRLTRRGSSIFAEFGSIGRTTNDLLHHPPPISYTPGGLNLLYPPPPIVPIRTSHHSLTELNLDPTGEPSLVRLSSPPPPHPSTFSPSITSNAQIPSVPISTQPTALSTLSSFTFSSNVSSPPVQPNPSSSLKRVSTKKNLAKSKQIIPLNRASLSNASYWMNNLVMRCRLRGLNDLINLMWF
ncbi:UNVERIFIED_CONTAM: hypothetical protein Slati_2143600 [Sesamum latifolium]|uniref:Zinc knuckle CX2CX4HX4C domain-containing protein n=1 Tax=Sesamum latifolium TaxID=2727402 RepID=A0AAW2WTD0_9LAMI